MHLLVPNLPCPSPSSAQEGDAALAELRSQLEAERKSRAAEVEQLSTQVRGDGLGQGEGVPEAGQCGCIATAGIVCRMPASGAITPGPSTLPHPIPPPAHLPQLAEAQALAGYSAGEMAELVQQLAEAKAERGEAAAKLAEAREEVARLRSGAGWRAGSTRAVGQRRRARRSSPALAGPSSSPPHPPPTLHPNRTAQAPTASCAGALSGWRRTW